MKEETYTQQYKAMTEAMKVAGWQAQKDVFDYIYAWVFPANGKQLARAVVDRHWTTHGEAPVPF